MRHHALAFLIISILSSIIYSNSLDVPFIYDDIPHIVRDKDVHVEKIGLNEALSLVAKTRPVSMITFALNYRSGGLNVSGYHIVNLLIHIMAAFGLFNFAYIALSILERRKTKLLSSKYNEDGINRAIYLTALLAALLWLTNPLQTQAVTYIVQRMASMAAMFYIWSAYFFLRGRISHGRERIVCFLICFLLMLLAFGSKQNAFTLPFIFFLLEVLIVRGGDLSFIKKRRVYIPLAVISLSLPLIGFLFFQDQIYPYLPYKGVFFVIKERVFTEARVIMTYVSLFFLPLAGRLNIEHDIELSSTLFDPPETIIAVTVLFIVGLFAVASIRRRPLISFLLLWIFVNLAIEYMHVRIAVMYEHRIYLPFMAVAILIARFIMSISPGRKKLVIVLAVLILFLNSVNTYSRNLIWQDRITLWSDSVVKSPYSLRAQLGHGLALLVAGRTEEAIDAFEKGRQINPRDPFLLYHLGLALYNVKLYDKAIVAFRGVWRQGYDNPEGYPSIDKYFYDMARYYAGTGRLNEATELLKEAAFFHPENAKVKGLLQQLERNG